jgi:BON domain-containing protein
MRSQAVIPFVIGGLLIGGCANDNKRITAEPGRQATERRTNTSASAPTERAKKPPVSQPQEAPKSLKHGAPPVTPSTGGTHDEQIAGLPDNDRNAMTHAGSVTPLDQSGREADLAVTQRIRQALVREDLSFAAKNVLVITDADHVVLKGRVRSQAEAEQIKGIAGMMTTKKIEYALEIMP